VTQRAQRAQSFWRGACAAAAGFPGKFFLLSTSVYKRGQSVDRRTTRGLAGSGRGLALFRGAERASFCLAFGGSSRSRLDAHGCAMVWTGLENHREPGGAWRSQVRHEVARVFFAGRSGLLMQTRSANKGFRLCPVVRLSQWSELRLGDQNFGGKSMLIRSAIPMGGASQKNGGLCKSPRQCGGRGARRCTRGACVPHLPRKFSELPLF
jgi:hypothetical protein